MRCATIPTILLALGCGLACAEDPDPAPLPECIDAIAVGRVLSQSTHYVPADPDAFLDPVPWKMRWSVQRTLAGPKLPYELTTMFESHAGVGEQLPHVLLLLQKVGHRWRLLDVETDIVRTRDGNFAYPVFRPAADEFDGRLANARPWLPTNWRSKLVTIDYDATRYDYLWTMGRESTDAEDDWIRIERGRVIARRGLLLSDLRPTSPSALCHRGWPDYWPAELRSD